MGAIQINLKANRRASPSGQWFSAGIVLGGLFVVPIVAARFMVGGTWVQIAAAYLVWIVFQSLLLGSGRGVRQEKLGCMFGISLVLTSLAVPGLTALMRIGGFLAF